MEHFNICRRLGLALLPLFVALGAVMYCTRHIDWHARDGGLAGGTAAK